MNIFVLSRDPVACARAHADRHCVKMILEYAQLLSTACRLAGVDAGYKATHANHPCALWTRARAGNWLWLRRLALALCDEYEHRYGRRHKSRDVIEGLPVPPLSPARRVDWANMAQAMPEEFRVPGDAVAAYRAYYRSGKAHLHRWTARRAPAWVRRG